MSNLCNTHYNNFVNEDTEYPTWNYNFASLGPTNQNCKSISREPPCSYHLLQSQVKSIQHPIMYGEHNQYTQNYQAAYDSYNQNYSAPPNYDPYQTYAPTQAAYSQQGVQQVTTNEDYPHAGWEPVRGYLNMNQSQPSNQAQNQQQETEEVKDNKDAVAQELKHQKAQMAKQRDDYVKKIVVLRRELELLKAQKQELLAEHSPNRDNNYIMKENNKLQSEIQSKMKTINSVIEMLTNIIGDGKSLSELETHLVSESPKHRSQRSMSVSTERPDTENHYNYVHYDPELHWCRICDVFPKSAKDLLMHLHSKEHKEITQERDMVDTPWHKLPAEQELPYYKGAPKKRLPIKGLQFFISSTAWYCKLCDVWMGDLHCASQHLKSQNHNVNYTNFVEQNPHWELEWLKDRERALSRTANSISKTAESDEDFLEKSKKKRDKHSSSVLTKENKKKRKKSRKKKKHARSSDSSSSSSSSDSSSDEGSSGNDKTKSIRVAMRNKMKLQAQMIMNEDLGGKWEVLGRLVEEERKKKELLKSSKEMGKESEPEDTLISQWMTVKETEDKDKKLLDNLKDRMKQKQEAEKMRILQMEQKRMEKERQEKELLEKRQREEKEEKEREEAQKRELEEIRLRERERIKFKTNDKYRKRYSPEESVNENNTTKSGGGSVPTKEKSRRSRSSSAERKKYRSDKSPVRYRKEYSDRRSRSKTPNEHHRSKRNKRSPSRESDSSKKSKKPPPPPSFRKFPFIGRMPLFKNKKNDDKPEKEIKKEEYDQPRQTRFQPGTLARAFIPDPDVVCFPKLSTIPPIMEPPPPPPPCLAQPRVPSPPKISEENVKTKKTEGKKSEQEKSASNGQHREQNKVVLPPPFPMTAKPGEHLPQDFQDALSFIYPDQQQTMEMPPYPPYSNMDYDMMYGQQSMYYNTEVTEIEQGPPLPPPPPSMDHTMPLQPPPLPPDDPNDDLAMLGISADDMAAQMF